MRAIQVLLGLVFLVGPSVAHAQSFLLQGSAGPTLVDSGYSISAGFGVAPASRVTLLFDVERAHLSSRLRSDGRGGTSGFRGGTLTLAAAEVRGSLFGRERVGPYGVAGFAAGVSRPTVSDAFPQRVTNGVRAVFFGGGVQVPLRNQLQVFADARMMVGGEAGELLAVAPVRVGVAWRF